VNNVRYNKPPPDDYRCGVCKITGVKLWREYQTFSPKLLCVRCACRNQNVPCNVDDDGKRPSELHPSMRTDQIGWYVPAIPDEEGIGFWGYTSVPERGCAWWRNLPTEKRTQ